MILDWDEYFMGVALLSSRRSKDPNTPVGACIINNKKQIVGVGYNGMPRGCDDKDFPWVRDANPVDSKYMYVVHAELNAILNSITGLDDCTLYSTLFPCNECTKAIIQTGIKKIFYLEDKYSDTDSIIASKKMLDYVGIEYVALPMEDGRCKM